MVYLHRQLEHRMILDSKSQSSTVKKRLECTSISASIDGQTSNSFEALTTSSDMKDHGKL